MLRPINKDLSLKLTNLREDLKKIDSRESNLQKLYNSGNISGSDLRFNKERLKKERENVLEEIKKIRDRN